ncbi:MAG: heavy metal translocating P-type ATPase [Gemmatimonadales bacterium]
MTITLAEPPSGRGPHPDSARPLAAGCAHCGLPVPTGGAPRGGGAATDPADPADQFCCAGCRTAWQVIHAAGLEAYYTAADRRGQPVEATGRRYDEYDHPAFQALYTRPAGPGQLETTLYLDGVHCASCVWLVERVPLAVPGAVSAELNVPRSLARIRWNPQRTSLGAIARFLDQLGYRSHPFLGARAEAHRQAEDRAMLVQIGVAGALAINVMTVALALYAGWLGSMEAVYTRYFRWISMILTVPAVLWPGRVFFTSAWGALRARRLHMDVPIALALGAGVGRGVVNTLSDHGPVYFDGVVTLIFLLLVGRYLQQRAQRAAADSAELLHGLMPTTSRLVEGETIREVPTAALLPDAIVEARPGDTIPADGVVSAGESAIDLSVLTGETTPAPAAVGDRVYAGTTNTAATLRIRVTEAGETSRLGRILRELEAGMLRRAPVVHTADRLAGWFVVGVLGLAVATWWWWSTRDPANALDHAIALLIVTCPCALALATPLAMTVAIGRAAKRGILIRGGDALEVLSRPTPLFLDKTGTLTEGRLALVRWTGPIELRGIIKGIERHSGHPIGRAFERAWPEVAPAVVAQVAATLGGGLDASVGTARYRIGSPGFVLAAAADPNGLGATVPNHLTQVLVARDGVVVGAAGLGDPLRADTSAAIDRLRARGFAVRILSGDAPGAVAAVADALGVARADARGGATPEDKVAAIARQADLGPVVMVGDGVNDAPAIGRATVGIGVRGGAEACLAAADVFLARPGLVPLADLVDGAGRTLRVIRANIAVSIGYNIVGAALAVTGMINPLLAAIMMPVSSLTVILLSAKRHTFEAPDADPPPMTMRSP